MGKHGNIDAAAVVDDRELRVHSRRELRVAVHAIGMVEANGFAPDTDASAAGDGVTRVDEQVGENLVELHRVEFHLHRFAARVPFDTDVFADQAPVQMDALRNRFVQFEHPGRRRLLSGEGEQLAGHLRRTERELVDVRDVRGGGTGGVELSERQLRVADDGRERVVEVVRDAAGKLADQLHLLVLQELLLKVSLLLFGLFEFGNLRHHRHHAGFSVDDGPLAAEHRPFIGWAVLVIHSELAAFFGIELDDVASFPAHFGEVIGVHPFQRIDLRHLLV